MTKRRNVIVHIGTSADGYMAPAHGAKFDSKDRTIVFSRYAPPADAPSGMEFANGAIGPFVSRLRVRDVC